MAVPHEETAFEKAMSDLLFRLQENPKLDYSDTAFNVAEDMVHAISFGRVTQFPCDGRYYHIPKRNMVRCHIFNELLSVREEVKQALAMDVDFAERFDFVRNNSIPFPMDIKKIPRPESMKPVQ